MLQRLFTATTLLFMAGVVHVNALGTPFGYAAGVTGGGNAGTQTPSSLDELKTWLEDSTPRRITLNKLWDFTNYWGTETGNTCKPWTCTPNPQEMISSSNNFCSGQTIYQSTWYSMPGLKVGSNKTLLGQGSNTGIKGAGLKINGVSNVIIQNIKITDINAKYVWGGDAIAIDNASNIWIDHNYFNRVGRQFIVTGLNAVSGLTVSHNIFDGQADYSTGCDGHHYWVFLFAAPADRITLAYNRIYYTAGRAPHIGGTGIIHLVNNLFDSISGHAMEPDSNVSILVEGNYWYNVKDIGASPGSAGHTYFLTSSNVAACTSALGRTCQANGLSGTTAISAADTYVLSTVASESAVKSITPMAASAVQNYVLANAGTGKTIT